ncbi:MAG: branched-chain amino acid ABC transporter ATP-binding protein/permease [Alphaproteobacteria bacterium]|jgi:ABC-type branched-subunit amino acid transport system ATPase component/ABC-type branched-subunit amino acid transport system permease subunit|nr:branched-chain amino acid ABC transporter ATP-binding protein/permease [Alphaproteobacteria bacterium]
MRWMIAVTAVAALLPFGLSGEYALLVATQLWVFYMVVVGLNLLTGYGGQTSIGHGALVAVGAYVAAIGMVDYKLSFWLALPLAMLGTGAAGALMALPTFRLSTWYFALITLGFARVISGLLVELEPITHGFSGVIGVPMPRVGGYEFSGRAFYWLVLALAFLAYLVTSNLIGSRYGRALMALRDNPLAGIGAGISLGRLKIMAFVYSAALAGAGGAMFAVQKTVITPEDFTTDLSIFFLLVVVLGGLGRRHGPLIGALAFFLLPELLTDLQKWRMLIYGAGLLLLTIYAPDGIAGALEGWFGRFRPRKAAASAPVSALPQLAGAELAVAAVTKTFGGVTAVADLSLQVPAGTVHAVVGPNGSGKTTLLNLITGFYPVDGGRILVAGTDVVGRGATAIARGGVRRTFQTPKLIPGLSVIENVMLGAFTAETASLAEVALNLPRARREAAERRAEAMSYLRFVGLDVRADDPAGDIPHGQQRLIEIARALVGRPSLLLLDEPAAGLSLAELDGLCALIKAIAALGTTVVIVEHHLDLVASLAQSVTVLDRGHLLAAGTPEAVFRDPGVIAAYMGARALSGTEASHAA